MEFIILMIALAIGIPLMQWGEKHDDPEVYRKRHRDDTFFYPHYIHRS